MPKKTRIRWVWLALAVSLLDAGSWAKDRGTNPPSLRVSVFDDADLEPGRLQKAEKVASRVYARSGVSVEWLNCGRPKESSEEQAACSEANSPSHLHVRIRPKSWNLRESTLGISYLDEDGVGCEADVFYAGVALLVGTERTNPDLILGLVMAHELGHLLLGTNSHAATGLMRALWNTEDFAAARMGRLVFTEEQSDRLRARLEAALTSARTVGKSLAR